MGCGKTILSSHIITDISQICRKNVVGATTCFYFDFRDSEKQKWDKLIRSLVLQLTGQAKKRPETLDSLYSSCDDGKQQPKTENLIVVLKEALEGLGKTYIILDAMDECSDRNELFSLIEKIWSWELPELHMLFTSRPLLGIEKVLQKLTKPGERIEMNSGLVDIDILTYIHERLQTDQKLRRWQSRVDMLEEIEKALMKKADGM